MTAQNNSAQHTRIEISHAQDSRSEVDISAWLTILSEAKWLIMLFILLGGGVGFIIHYLSPPVFSITAKLHVDSNSSIDPALTGMGVTGSDGLAMTEAQILLSRQTMGEVVNEFHLNYSTSLNYFPFIGQAIANHYDAKADALAAPLFGLDSFAWGGEVIKIKTLKVPDSWINKPLQLFSVAGNHFRLMSQEGEELLKGKVGEQITANGFTLRLDDLRIRASTPFNIMYRSKIGVTEQWLKHITAAEEIRGTNVLKLSSQTEQPLLDKKVMNQLLRVHIRKDIEYSSAESGEGVKFIAKQLPHLRKELDKAQQKLNDYLQKRGKVDVNYESNAVLGQIIALDKQIADLEIQRADTLLYFTAKTDKIMAIDRKLNYIRKQRQSLQKQIKTMPETSQEVIDLQRNVQVASDLYISLVSRSQELSIAQASNVGNLRIIDLAVIPDKPISLGQTIIIALGLIAGFLLGIVTALGRKLIRNTIDDPEEIEQLGLTVYACVPHSKQQQSMHKAMKSKKIKQNNQHFLLALKAPNDLAIESLRNLRTSLQFSAVESEPQCIMITSSAPNAGKSFISANLARLLQDSGKHVLLIDADIRRGHLHNYINCSGTPGLSEVLQAEAMDWHTAVVQQEDNALIDLLPRGKVPANPAELLMHPNFSKLIQAAKQEYDAILIDTPPVLAVTDALIIGKHANFHLFVLRAGVHHKREIQQALAQLNNAGITVGGAIFNDVVLNNGRGYGAYGSYAYQYNYKSQSTS